MARVVVTGASGHLGANLVRLLLERGERVRVVVRRARTGLEGLPVEVVPGDVLDPPSLRAAFAGAEVVYHLAGLISLVGSMGGQVEAVNVQGARQVAEAALAQGVRRLVHFSSAHAFRQQPAEEPLDERRERAGPGESAYDQSKTQGEEAVRAVVARGLDAVVVHPSAVIGPHDYLPSRLGRVLLAAAQGPVWGAVGGGFDWVDARDVAQGAIAAAERGQTGESYLLAGEYRPVSELLRLTAGLTGAVVLPFTLPLGVARTLAPGVLRLSEALGVEPLFTPESIHTLAHGNRRILSDKAARELGYSPRSLESTLRDTLRFFVDQGWLRRPLRERA